MRTLVLCFIPMLVLSTARQGQARDGKAPYVRPAPIEQYLMGRGAEVALARTAAPPSISRDAEVLVLTRHGYEAAVKGKNGFVCLVGRSWMLTYDDPEFLDPAVRLPLCLNPAAVRSHLPFTFMATKLALARQPKDKMFAALRTAFRDKELPLPELGSMCYMMSQQQYFGPKDKNADPHLMFWFAQTDKVDWGAGGTDAPIYVTQDAPDPVTTFVVPTPTWSDGSPNLADR